LHRFKKKRLILELPLDKIWQQFIYNPDAKILFTSGLFIFLFFGFLLLYWLLQARTNLRIVWVILFSLFFYYKCAGIYWVLHVVIVVVDYHLALWIERSDTSRKKKGLLVLSLILNLGILVGFKYTNYIGTTYAAIVSGQFTPWDILLPVGVSFFTFQSLSYTIDVYRGELKALDKILDYAFFVTFFPQMVAGPIVRAADFLPQIRVPLIVTREQFGRAVFLICTGIFKKAVIADYIGVNFVDLVFDTPEKYTGLENLFAVYGYALQIYGDFSGYSDMAIGIALLMGFTFPINFDAPYQSVSVTEFWRRWHISLSTWLRDYLYIPLGGNRSSSIGTWLIPGAFFGISLLTGVFQVLHGGNWWILIFLGASLTFFVIPAIIKGKMQELSTSFNLLSTMLLGGLWHGASNQFIIWGMLHGTALSAERWWKTIFKGSGGLFRKVLGGIWTFHFVCFCWIFFRADSMELAFAMLLQIGTAFNGQILPEFVNGYAPVVSLMAVGFLLHFLPGRFEYHLQKWVTALPLPAKALLLFFFAVLVMQVKSSDVQPFKYFDF
jgi:alginate O-acetyltransferase complex protein AlgI